MKLVYSREAIADLRRLRDFIAEHDPAAAAGLTQELIQRIEALCQFPRMGVALEQALRLQKYAIWFLAPTLCVIRFIRRRWPCSVSGTISSNENDGALSVFSVAHILVLYTVQVWRIHAGHKLFRSTQSLGERTG